MKRTIITAAAVALLAAPAIASAGLSTDTSPASSARGGQLSIGFEVFREGNQPVGVDNFNVKRLRIDCRQGTRLLNFTLNVPGDPYFPVNDRDRFRATGENANSAVRITGEFVTNRKVEGRIKAEGDFGRGAKNCEGSAPYVAR
jgi:hypothetical protein